MKKAFTLIEINLAILAMAGGILSVVVLYSLGFRETRQNQEDLASSAYADTVLGPIVAAFSARNVSWDKFNAVQTTPAEGQDENSKRCWEMFLDSNGRVIENHDADSLVKSFGADPKFPKRSQGYYGLVVCHDQGSSIVRFGFRASKKLQTLLTAPLYYTEVRFQGYKESD